MRTITRPSGSICGAAITAFARYGKTGKSVFYATGHTTAIIRYQVAVVTCFLRASPAVTTNALADAFLRTKTLKTRIDPTVFTATVQVMQVVVVTFLAAFDDSIPTYTFAALFLTAVRTDRSSAEKTQDRLPVRSQATFSKRRG